MPERDHTLRSHVGLRSSAALTLPAIVAFVAGLGVGVGVYVARRDEVVVHDPSTNAITAHIVLGVVLAMASVAYRRRSPAPTIFAPIGPRAVVRVRATARAATHGLAGALRTLAAAAISSMMLYLVFRIGVQITAGLAPAFVTNAWGGPTAMGAFLARALDATAAIMVCAFLMDRVLLDPGGDERTAKLVSS